MSTNLMMAYETLEIEDQKLVEKLIYSLMMKAKNNSTADKERSKLENKTDLISELESLKGILTNCNYSSVEEARKERLAQKYGVNF